MPGEDPDAQRMLAYQRGDETALADLYGRWSGPVTRFLERMVQERGTAEELMQEAFLRVHRARDRYRPEARFSTWLFQIARNLALNELDRARRRHPHLVAEEGTPLGPRDAAAGRGSGPGLTLVAGGPDAAAMAEQREAAARVDAAMSDLPERQRSALWLAAVEGQSYAEIAAVLETSPQSVKALVHRARVTLVSKVEAASAAGSTGGIRSS